MAEIKASLQNGVSYGLKYTVTATDVSDGYVTINFQANVDLVANIQVLNMGNIVVDTKDAKITYPAAGKVKIEPYGTFVLELGQKLLIFGNRNVAEIYSA